MHTFTSTHTHGGDLLTIFTGISYSCLVGFRFFVLHIEISIVLAGKKKKREVSIIRVFHYNITLSSSILVQILINIHIGSQSLSLLGLNTYKG